MQKDFFRKVGFGLRPDEDVPSDPLNWALAQLDSVPELIWPEKVYSGEEMQDYRLGFRNAESELQDTVKDQKTYDKRQKEINYRYGRRYFEGYELAIRHHQAIYGTSPVFERFYQFWGNHFTIIDKNSLRNFNIGVYHRESLRPNMVTTYADMVYAATISWPMIKSLDNFKSVGENSKQNRDRRKHGRSIKSLNENHARELLELHTVSPEVGYTQEDVIQLANLMTGWGFEKKRRRSDDESMLVGFDPNRHEPGKKTILGKTYVDDDFFTNARGKKLLRQVIDDLAMHPATMRFVATKLCQHFITDTPTEEMIAPVIRAWEASGGNMIAIQKAVIESVWSFGADHKKFHSPEIWLQQVARISGSPWPGDPRDYQYSFKFGPGKLKRRVQRVLNELGHNPYRAKQPNGFIDQESEWISPEYLIRRIAFMNESKSNYFFWTDEMDAAFMDRIIEKNFDAPEELLAYQRKFPVQENGTHSYVAFRKKFIMAFCHERMFRA